MFVASGRIEIIPHFWMQRLMEKGTAVESNGTWNWWWMRRSGSKSVRKTHYFFQSTQFASRAHSPPHLITEKFLFLFCARFVCSPVCCMTARANRIFPHQPSLLFLFLFFFFSFAIRYLLDWRMPRTKIEKHKFNQFREENWNIHRSECDATR